MKTEIRPLTGIRGIAALYVLLFHFYFLSNQKHAPTSLFRHFLDNGYLSVDLFFVLSGFVITLSSHKLFTHQVTRSDYIAFMKKRAVRIYPAYFIILIVASIVNHFHPLTSIGLSVFLLSIFSPKNQVLGVFWSLSVEWVIYWLLPIWIWVTTKFYKWKYLFLFTIFIVCYSSIYVRLWGNYRLTAGYINMHSAFMRSIGSYAWGIMMFEARNIPKKQYWFTDVIAGLILLSLLFYKMDIVFVFLSGILINRLSLENESITSKICSSKIVYWLGEISYSLYLIHQLILMPFENPDFLLGNRSILAFTCFLCVSLMAAHVYHKCIELPLGKFFKKRILVV